MDNILSRFKEVDTFVFDVDGVFTDGGLLVNEEGEMWRKMNAKDGFAVRTALDQGFQVFIITGGTSHGVANRFEKLGCTGVYIAVQDKLALLNQLEKQGDIKCNRMVYMGDDLPDKEAMLRAKVPCCPYDAVPEILSLSQWISTKKGGESCVRELIEQVLRVQNKWNF